MQIHGPAHLHGPQPINSPHKIESNEQSNASQQSTPVDQLDISPEADLVSRARSTPDIRQDLVARIRSEIAAGKYETEEKISGAVDALLDEFG